MTHKVKERSRLFKFILLIYTVYKKKSFKQVHSQLNVWASEIRLTHSKTAWVTILAIQV